MCGVRGCIYTLGKRREKIGRVRNGSASSGQVLNPGLHTVVVERPDLHVRTYRPLSPEHRLGMTFLFVVKS